jgi:hypothetical protein
MASIDENRITYFGETDFRNKRTRFGIKALDRGRHMYVIGKTGMGKSTLLENLAIQDIQNGEGMAFLDPHGGTAEKLLDYVPENRIKDVLYFAPFDMDYPVSFNVMEDVGADKRHLVSSGLMSTFKKIWVDAWSARMEYILNNILLALLEYPEATLLGVNRMLSDKDYRKKVVDNVSDPAVKSFWIDEFAKYGDRYMQEAGAAIQNKIGQFTSNPVIRNIIGQPRSTFDIRKIMDERKILIINLSKGRVGEQNASLLGGMLITKIYLGAMSRAEAPAAVLKNLPPFYLYVDEFQSFANASFADILSEARKYKLRLTVAHQYIEQMSEEVRDAVFGNVGTTIAFRVGPFDAEVLEKIFFPTFTKEDIVNLGVYQIYLTLMVDGIGSKPFSSNAMAPIAAPAISFKDAIIRASRETYAKHKTGVEEEIKRWHEPVIKPMPKKDFKDMKSVDTYKVMPKPGIASPARDSFGPRVAPLNQTLKNPLPAPHQNRPNPAPVASSPKLKDILNQLEGKAKEIPVQEIPAPVRQSLGVGGEKPRTVSLADLKRPAEAKNIPVTSISSKTDKGPSEKNVSALKDLLVKVSPPEAKKEEKPVTQAPKHQPKEVPEDVLRNILQ